jgi:1,4-dihydroxy-2-naphthoyl-CoA synthase
VWVEPETVIGEIEPTIFVSIEAEPKEGMESPFRKKKLTQVFMQLTDIGLAWKVVPGDQVMDEARALAERLCRAAPLAARATKEVATRTATMSWAEAVRFGETMRRVAAATDDAAEGRRAWSEKRPPDWQGR